MKTPLVPKWLVWARDLQALAQSGLAYAESPFDRERYESIMKIAADMMATGSNADMARVLDLFAGQEGYATPKAVVRAAVFDAQGRILLVREVLDQHRWTLPGGWADVNLTPLRTQSKKCGRKAASMSVSPDLLPCGTVTGRGIRRVRSHAIRCASCVN